MRNDYVIKKAYRSFMLVSVLAAITTTIGMLIDNIIAGWFLGSESLGAMGIISPVVLVVAAFGSICAGGGTALMAQEIGRGNVEAANGVYTATVLFALIAGIALTVIGLVFYPQIASLLGARGELYAPTAEYLSALFWCPLPMILSTTMMGFVKVDGSTALPLLSIVVMTIVNILLDMVMIFVFHLGMFGLALATVIAYCCAVAVVATHFLKSYNTLRFVLPHGIWRQMYSVIKVGMPSALQRICNTVRVIFLNYLLIITVGAGAVIALNVRTQIYNNIGALMIGLGVALLPVGGMLFGEQDKAMLKSILGYTLRLGLALSGVLGLVLLVFPSFFSGLLGVNGSEILTMSNLAIQLFAVGLPIQLVNTVFLNYYQCTAHVKMASVITILETMGFTVVFSLLLIGKMGASAVWLGMLLAELGALLLIVFWIAVKRGRLPHGLEDFMLLSSDFGGGEKLELSISNDMREVTAFAVEVYRFGAERGWQESLVHKLSLCIEEMADSIVKYALGTDGKKWLDLMILDKEDRLILRMRDNGTAFDPVAIEKVRNDAEKGLGISLVLGIADEVSYNRSIGMNHVTIVLLK